METGPRNEARREGGRDAASHWLGGRAAFPLRTCAVALRRGRGGAEARCVPDQAPQDPAGRCGSRPRHVVLPGLGKWRSQRPLCGAGLSSPRRRPRPRRHCCVPRASRAAPGARPPAPGDRLHVSHKSEDVGEEDQESLNHPCKFWAQNL